jgi:hypothetical protein
LLGDYNVPRYLANFNKRVEPLLCVFSPEIRDAILIEDPLNRNFFTKKQTELVNGFPLKESGQDNFDEVMTLSNSEITFWNKVKKDPYFMYVEESLNEVDQNWVNFNRNLVNNNDNGTDLNEDEIININEEIQINLYDF